EQASDELEDTEHSEPEIDDAPRANELKSRLIGSAILTVPLFFISMFTAFQFPHWGWVAMWLSLPVTFWGGWPFHRGAVKAARHGGSIIVTLVSIVVTAVCVCSCDVLAWLTRSATATGGNAAL